MHQAEQKKNLRFLIVKPSSLGDILHAFPAVEALRETYPGAVIDWVVHPAFHGLLDYMPGVENRILFKRKELGRLRTFFPAFFRLWKDLRKNRYDAVIDLQGLMRSAIVARLARAPFYYGPEIPKEKIAGFFYSRTLSFPEKVLHAVERNCRMIRNVDGVETADPDFQIPESPEQKEKAERLLREKGFLRKDRLLIAVAPGARWVTKQWPPEFFADVMKKIAEKRSDVLFLILGSPSEKELSEKVVRQLGAEAEALNLCGQTDLGELVELIRMADLLICNDSGPMHIAASAGTRVLAFFGPTDPDLTGPYCREKRVFQPAMECMKCFRKSCPEPLCHHGISAQEAAEAALELTGRS